MTPSPFDYDVTHHPGDATENIPQLPEDWHPRESAGANLAWLGICALIVAILVYTALRQVTG